jgi:acetyltransferase-like isoleucine patch superfamily enzyme
MKFFRAGGILYGLVYSVWRGWGSLGRLLATWFYHRTLGSCGRGTVFGTGVYVSHPKAVSIGTSCIIGSRVLFASEHSDGRLMIGDRVQISEDCRIDYTGNVYIGDNALLSAGVRVYSHSHGYHPRDPAAPEQLSIEADVWIGLGSVVLSGVGKIGRAAIVGAGAVVTEPIPEYAVAVGNPARVIKVRRSES